MNMDSIIILIAIGVNYGVMCARLQWLERRVKALADKLDSYMGTK